VSALVSILDVLHADFHVSCFRFTGLTLMMKTTLLTKRHLCTLMVNCGTSVLQAWVTMLLQQSTITVSWHLQWCLLLSA